MKYNPSFFKKRGDDCPVDTVSWFDAQAFIAQLNKVEGRKKYRLPTEAEWEYACRAGSTTRFCFGNYSPELEEYAWYIANSERTTHPVGQKRPNAWGLYDMHGNVWEWCQDWSGDYPEGPISDPTGAASGQARVLRGGTWLSDTDYLRSAGRVGFSPDFRYHLIGFRLARDS
jgi:formylglycine-generating enzyme required for sulfatase activity